jgi:hypothetical protein
MQTEGKAEIRKAESRNSILRSLVPSLFNPHHAQVVGNFSAGLTCKSIFQKKHENQYKDRTPSPQNQAFIVSHLPAIKAQIAPRQAESIHFASFLHNLTWPVNAGSKP